MNSRWSRCLAQAVFVASMFASASAYGQAWLADRARTQGPGLRLGDLELHPGVGAEIGYDSNVFYSDSDPEGSAILRITPHLLLSTLSDARRGEGEARGNPPSVAFSGGLSMSFYHYFIDRARDNLGGDADLRLTINPERPFSVVLFERFGRTIRPFTESAGVVNASDYSRNQNRVGAEFQLSTVGGVLQAKAGYAFDVDYFEGQYFQYTTNLTHFLTAGASFRFLPTTAFVYDLEVALQNYPNADDAPLTLVSDNVRIRSRVGLNGAVTERFSVTAMVGYAAGFYENFDDFETVIGQAELRWQFSPNFNFRLGYQREYQTAFVGNFYRMDRGYTRLELLLGGAFLFGGELGAGYFDFGRQVSPTGMPIGSTLDRTDIRLTAGLFAEYRLSEWLGLNATVSYIGDFTDFEFLRMSEGMFLPPDPADFQKFEAWFGIRAFY